MLFKKIDRELLKEPINQSVGGYMESKRFTLNAQEFQKWVQNQLEFLKPLLAFSAAMYFPPLLGVLGSVGHVLSLADFVPSSAVITAVALYAVNASYDFLRKFLATSK